MKRYISIFLCLVIVASAFVACSKSDSKENPTTTTEKSTEITTDDAKIKEADAVNLMMSYSAEELGLSEKDKKECSFMVASSGEYIEEQKANYVKVVAVIKEAHENPETKEITYTFDYKGEYFISYDGKQILQKDMKTEGYKEMKVKDVPTTTTAQAEKE